MPWWGSYRARALVVNIHQSGLVRLYPWDPASAPTDTQQPPVEFLMRVVQAPWAEPLGPHDLLVLPGGARPTGQVASWVNDRGRGRLSVISPTTTGAVAVVAVELEGRTDQRDAGAFHRHPKAAFWLAMAAATHTPITLYSLVALTGLSYPTCRVWVQEEEFGGRLVKGPGQGRQASYAPTARGRDAWLSLVAHWWIFWRSHKWPPGAGRSEVRFLRPNGPIPIQKLPFTSAGDEPRTYQGAAQPGCGIWPTGADHLRWVKAIAQSRDTDVWCTKAAIPELETRGRWQDGPAVASGQAWEGVRVSLIEPDGCLARLLHFIADEPITGAAADDLCGLTIYPGMVDLLLTMDHGDEDGRIGEARRQRRDHLLARMSKEGRWQTDGNSTFSTP